MIHKYNDSSFSKTKNTRSPKSINPNLAKTNIPSLPSKESLLHQFVKNRYCMVELGSNLY